MSDPQQMRAGPTPSAIRGQLEHMLGQAPFDRSPVLSRFLAYAVEYFLRFDAPPPKEYTIGLEVFDRPDDFDPRIDTIVRVQARRLREALARYYDCQGKHDTVRLQMPKGQYGIRARIAESTGGEPVVDDRSVRSRSGASAAVSSLPVARTVLVGRAADVAQLEGTLVRDAARLLTITGVGGSGKTRLALAVAERVRGSFAGGVQFLDLSAVSDRQVLIGMLADAFLVRHTEGRPLEDVLAERVRVSVNQPILLVMDNMESVIDGVDVLGRLLDASDQLSFLVTSRIALRLYGESEYPLAPLAVPSSGAPYDSGSLSEVPSVQLFLMRAAAANPRLDLVRDVDALAELCVRLDGLPLAIELVAAQAGVMSPRQMLERFTGHLDLPPNPVRDAPSRQRTLRRVIDWSHDLLDQPARIALRRLSVFAGGFTLEAAQAVIEPKGGPRGDLLAAINSLVAMGLVHFLDQDQEPRFAMLETLRAYGTERLDASGETEVTRAAHAAYCLVLAEEGVGNLDRAQREAWLARCDQEQDNYRHAIHHLLHHGPPRWALRLGHALFVYWERREKFIEAQRLLDAITTAVPVATDPALWAKVTNYTATLTALQGDITDSDARYSRTLGLYRELGDQRGEASTLNALGVNARLRGNESAAREWMLMALDACRHIGDRSEIAAALSNLAQCDLGLGRTEGVLDLLTEAHDLFVSEKDSISATWCINHLGDLARAEGDYVRATEHYARAEAGFRQLRDTWGIARSLADRGQLNIDRGEPAAAAALLLDALDAFESLRHRRGMATVADSMAVLALAARQPGLAIRLLAAAEGWRAAVGFTGRREDLEHARSLRSQAAADMDEAELKALHDEGWWMSAADVADCVRDLLDSVAAAARSGGA